MAGGIDLRQEAAAAVRRPDEAVRGCEARDVADRSRHKASLAGELLEAGPPPTQMPPAPAVIASMYVGRPPYGRKSRRGA